MERFTLDDKISLEDLVQEVREIAENNPDFVYFEDKTPNPYGPGRCYYTKDSRPSCIIGRALFNLGISIETLRSMDVDDNDNLFGTGISNFFRPETKLDSDRMHWLSHVQVEQDAEIPWGRCVETGNKQFPNV